MTSQLSSPDLPLSPRLGSSSRGDSRSSPVPAAPAKSIKSESNASGSKQSFKVQSIRDQAIEKYTALTRHKRELLRKNMKIQTKIAQHLRKNKMELTVNTGKQLTEEEEKAEYMRLVQELSDLMETTERESNEFEQEMTDVQGRKRKTDRDIHKLETELESLRSKILKASRDSQTGSSIGMEMVHEINKKLATKESELRLLRMNQIKNRNKLKKQEMISKPQSMNNVTVKREELNLENKVYSDKLEDTEDRMASLRHTIAGDVVMLSHLAMKLFYVKMDTEQMSSEDSVLNKKLEEMKDEMIQLKIENMNLTEERQKLSERAGMISNTDLLRDFKSTQGDVQKTATSNEKIFSKIKHFYDL